MSECQWRRPTELLGDFLYHTDDIPPDRPDGTPCGGAECKDRRSYPWKYRKQRLGKIVLLANEPERRAPDQITDRRVAKGERRVPWVMHGYGPGGLYPYDSWPSGRRLRRPDKDRRQPKAAPADPRGPLRHDTDSGPCECGAWHEKDKPAKGIVKRLRDPRRHDCICANGGDQPSCHPDAGEACEVCLDRWKAEHEAAAHIEQQAAEIQRLQAALTYAETANANTAGIVADLNREVARLREALERIRDEGHGDGWAEIARAPMLLADIAKKALTPKEPNGADQEAE